MLRPEEITKLLASVHEPDQGKTRFHEFMVPSAIAMLRSIEATQSGSSAVILEPNRKAPMAPTDGFSPVDVFCGLPACGKDYMASKLIDLGISRPVLGFGEMLAQRMAVARDDLRMENPLDMEDHYDSIVEEVLTHSPAILTSHPVFRQGDNTWAFIPKIYNQLAPRNFVVVISDPTDILKWGEARKGTHRKPPQPIEPERLDSRQMIVYSTLLGYAAGHGNGLTLVMNKPHMTDKNVEFISRIITTYDQEPWKN